MPSTSNPTNSQQMPKDSAPFDSQAYQNYKAQVDKQREIYSEMSITEMLYDLGYKIDTLCNQLIQVCDKILEETSPPKSS
jgi:hypothetical protein